MATFAKSNLDKIARGLETTGSGTTLYDLVVAIRAELDDIRTKYAAMLTLVNEIKTEYGDTLAKLDADAGVTDVNYASTNPIDAADASALAAAAFATSAS